MDSREPSPSRVEIGFLALAEATMLYFAKRYGPVPRTGPIGERLKSIRLRRVEERRSAAQERTIPQGTVTWGYWIELCAARIRQGVERGDLPMYVQPLGGGVDDCPVLLGTVIRLTPAAISAWPKRPPRGSRFSGLTGFKASFSCRCVGSSWQCTCLNCVGWGWPAPLPSWWWMPSSSAAG